MGRRRVLLGFTLSLILCLVAIPASAEDVVEAYRSPFGIVGAVSVDPRDGSVWLSAGRSLLHLAPDGTLLSQTDDLVQHFWVGAGAPDGSCWVIDEATREAVRVGAHGEVVLRVPFPEWAYFSVMAVDPNDGSCWVGVVTPDGSVGGSGPDLLVHLAMDGSQLWEGEFVRVKALSVNSSDGSCWVVDNGLIVTPDATPAVVHLAADGSEILRNESLGMPLRIAVNSQDGSVWVTNEEAMHELVHWDENGTELWRDLLPAGWLAVNQEDGSVWAAHREAQDGPPDEWDLVSHLSAEGTLLWQSEGEEGDFVDPGTIDVDASDGSVWLTDWRYHLIHLAADGTELWRNDFLDGLIAADPRDGSCVVAGGHDVRRVTGDGTEIWRVGGFGDVRTIGLNAADGSCWVQDGAEADPALVHLAADGSELGRLPGLTVGRFSISVNSADGSLWTASGDVWHLAEDGTQLWSGDFDPFSARVVAVDPSDGSCWVIARGSQDPPESWLIRLAEDGSEQWRCPLTWGTGLSVNPTDGSCWVSDEGKTYAQPSRTHQAVYLFAPDGSVLWRTEDSVYAATRPRAVSVDPSDGTCWVADDTSIRHLSTEGELSRAHGFYQAQRISFNPADGSCWVGDTGNGQIVRLVAGPDYPDVPDDSWAHEAIVVCAAADIVAGYPDGLYHGSTAVTRDQMAVYIARALAGGDESVPEFTDTPTFPDVEAENWALDYVEYAVSQNVVAGYGDGNYHPEYEVTRDQMAVYVARALVAPDGEDGLADYVPADPRNFPDVAADFWAYTHVEYCVEHGVVAGYLDGLYHPEIVVTRDQMAVYVARAFELTS